MQFHKKTSFGSSGNISRVVIKVTLFFVLIFVIVVLLDKVDFPSPNEKIQKVIPNENLKIVK